VLIFHARHTRILKKKEVKNGGPVVSKGHWITNYGFIQEKARGN
jgi:hypothetical protein